MFHVLIHIKPVRGEKKTNKQDTQYLDAGSNITVVCNLQVRTEIKTGNRYDAYRTRERYIPNSDTAPALCLSCLADFYVHLGKVCIYFPLRYLMIKSITRSFSNLLFNPPSNKGLFKSVQFM